MSEILTLLKRRAEIKLDRNLLTNTNFGIIENCFDEILINFQSEIYAEVKQTSVYVEVKYTLPDGWFQQFKQEVLPKWFLKYFPVKTKEHTVWKREAVEWVVPNKEFSPAQYKDERLKIPRGAFPVSKKMHDLYKDENFFKPC